MANQEIQNKEAIKKIQELEEKVQEEIDKGKDLNKEALFKLRYAQFIQGLYLQNITPF